MNVLLQSYGELRSREEEVEDRQKRSQTYSSAPDGRSLGQVSDNNNMMMIIITIVNLSHVS